MPAPFKYNTHWDSGEPAQIELACIERGGQWKNSRGEVCGAGLFHHFKAFAQIVWPMDWWSRWDDMMIHELVQPGMLGIAGPSSSGKTHRVSCTILTWYWAFPTNTTVLCSTTTRELLDKRIWGEIVKYWKLGRERFPWLSGHLTASRQAITTDGKDTEGRDFRNGISGVPCKSGTTWVGLGDYVGLKNDRVILACDEAMLMPPAFFDATGSLTSNPWFLLAALGNPNDPTNSFGQVTEPVDGWDSVQQGVKSQVWKTKFFGGRCLNLVGTDSPNLDYPELNEPFRKLIGRRYIREIAETYGTDNWRYQMWVLAQTPANVMERRVITRQLCMKFSAFDEPVWTDGLLTKIFAIDAAYGSVGGDRCMAGELHFGMDSRGKQTMAFIGKPLLVPVNNSLPELPEDQISLWVKDQCEQRGIPPQNVFFDGTGRASLMSSFARLWSPLVSAIEFGGVPTERPIRDGDNKTCRQEYGKMVTELWFSIRLIIEADQFRGMTESLMLEGQSRAWGHTKSNKIDVEPKSDTKLRLGRSPDSFDMLVTAVEGARRKGFRIERLGKPDMRKSENKWLREMHDKYRSLEKSKQLTYS